LNDAVSIKQGTPDFYKKHTNFKKNFKRMMMNPIEHTTAPASYYDTRADSYDAFNQEHSKSINALLEKILKEHAVSSILDLTCGTGSQVFWLHNAGFDVVGSDINGKMLGIAQHKAKLHNLSIPFYRGDCCDIAIPDKTIPDKTVCDTIPANLAGVRLFDSAITIFNSIGHLVRRDFKRTLQNIKRHLKLGGIYIFDIFNLDYLKIGSNIAKLTIDWIQIKDGVSIREIQFSTISDAGILTSYTTGVHQDADGGFIKVSKGYENTLQVYNSAQLQDVLREHGFAVLSQMGMHGEAFSPEHNERIITIAQSV
jgi:SAM-dependent methyltransferase